MPGTTTVLRQVTQTRVDGTTMSVHLEEAGGAPEDFVTTIIQQACFDGSSPTAPECTPSPPTGPPPTCTGGPTNCSTDQLRQIKGTLATAVARGSEAMSRAMSSSPDLRGKALTLVATGDLKFRCNTNPCDAFGEYDPTSKTMMVNTARLGGNQVQLSRTLFHEMLHSDARFTHNDRKNLRAKKACKLQIIDRTYACEVMAFGPQATECVCNRCLTPDGVEPRVPTCEYCQQHYPPCLGREETRPDGGTGNVSQAVGAWCARLQVFCDTAAECDSECRPIGSPCERSKSICDANCN